MKTLLVAGKGGGGKSSTAFNIAVVARRTGLRVGLIDADPQRSLSDMRVARGNADIPVQACRMEELPEKFALANRSRLDLLIIDTPPAIGAHTLAAIGLADFVLLPMRPTAFDLRATRHWINLLRSAAQPFGVIINAAPPRREGLDAPMVRDARNALHNLGVDAWRSQITHRHIIPQSAIGGRGVAEIDPAGPAAIEYAKLWQSILRAIDHIRSTHHEKSPSHVA
jgi:chromosome partitioning protein